jgi:hypothetical protein
MITGGLFSSFSPQTLIMPIGSNSQNGILDNPSNGTWDLSITSWDDELEFSPNTNTAKLHAAYGQQGDGFVLYYTSICASSSGSSSSGGGFVCSNTPTQQYISGPTFLTQTGAASIGSYPSTPAHAQSITIGNTIITGQATDHSGPDLVTSDQDAIFTTPLSGFSLAISGQENLDISFAMPVYSFGFDFYEPQMDTVAAAVSSPVDSTFMVTLFNNSTVIDSLTFNAPNDVISFQGVSSISPFNRVEIRETIGTDDNEFFGMIYTSSIPLQLCSSSGGGSSGVSSSGIFIPQCSDSIDNDGDSFIDFFGASSVIAEHKGGTNPTQEGWTASEGTAPHGLVTNDQGYDAWNINDNQTAGSAASYTKNLSSSDLTQLATKRWKLSTRVRVVDNNDSPGDISVWNELDTGSKRYGLHFGSDASGNPIVILPTAFTSLPTGYTGYSYTVQGGSKYHLYELIFDPTTNKAEVYVDGVLQISAPNYQGVTVSPRGPYLRWGNGSTPGVGNGNYNLVLQEFFVL